MSRSGNRCGLRLSDPRGLTNRVSHATSSTVAFPIFSGYRLRHLFATALPAGVAMQGPARLDGRSNRHGQDDPQPNERQPDRREQLLPQGRIRAIQAPVLHRARQPGLQRGRLVQHQKQRRRSVRRRGEQGAGAKGRCRTCEQWVASRPVAVPCCKTSPPWATTSPTPNSTPRPRSSHHAAHAASGQGLQAARAEPSLYPVAPSLANQEFKQGEHLWLGGCQSSV